MNNLHLPTEVESVADVQKACKAIRNVYLSLRSELAKVIVGQKKVLDLVLVSIFADGHVLLDGPPGLGKTLLVNTLSNALQLTNARIQCTADLMPADVIGTVIVDEDISHGKRNFRFRQGPIFNQLVLADEINRATPKCQSAMLEAMQEGSVSIDGITHQLPRPFFVMATQNPIDQEGTYSLPEAQLDRFMFKINIGSVSQDELTEILNRTTSLNDFETVEIINGTHIVAIQRLLKHLVIAPQIQDYAIRLVLATHATSVHAPSWVRDQIQIGASPRAAQAIVSSAKVVAAIDGRFAVSKRDICAVGVAALQHRITRTFEAQTAQIDSCELIERLFQDVPSYEGDCDE